MALRKLALFYCQFVNEMLLSYDDQQLSLTTIKAVIFDLDGTLVESETVWTEAKQYIAKREKVKVSQQVMLAYVGRSVTDFVKEVIAPANVPLIQMAIIERALARYDHHVRDPWCCRVNKKLFKQGFCSSHLFICAYESHSKMLKIIGH